MKRPFLRLVLLFSGSFSAFSQTYTIATVAGGGLPVGITATSAALHEPRAVAVDASGNVYLTDGNGIVLRREAATGNLTLVAGNGIGGYTGDGGPATQARMNPAFGIALDAAGNLYIADTANDCIREVSNGTITTIAGTGRAGFSGDGGPGVNAQLSAPQAIAFDSAGALYIADSANHRIRRIANGTITTVAGTGTAGYNGDNIQALAAQLNSPSGVAVDSAGNLYIADVANNRIRKVSNGVITTVAGTGVPGFSGDGGPAASAQVNGAASVAVDSAGNLFIADTGNSRIREVSNGAIATVAGMQFSGYNGDNISATAAELAYPCGVTVDSSNNIYFADFVNNRIRKVQGGTISTVAGGGIAIGDNGPATAAQIFEPVGIAADASGSFYISDWGNSRIRSVTNGVITTVAGNGTRGYGGDTGPATAAELNAPEGLALDSAGNLHISDYKNCRVRKLAAGTIVTEAGNGTCAYSGDGGSALNAGLTANDVSIDSAGNLYIADTDNSRVREISNGVITTIAGTGAAGYNGDGIPAAAAQLRNPTGVAVDSSGNVYVADYADNRVRKISNGVITTVAGTGTAGYNGDGIPATTAQLNGPFRVAVDQAGSLYIADTNSHLIRKVTNGIITTIAGGGASFGDSGPATSSQLLPYSLTVDSSGTVYVGDRMSNRVRTLTPSGAPCSVSVSPLSLNFAIAGGSLGIQAQGASGCAWAAQGLPDWLVFSGNAMQTGGGNFTLTASANAGAPRAAVISVAGASVLVTQAGAVACAYSLSAPGQTFSGSGGGGSFSIATSSGCSWSVSNSVGWVTGIAPASGLGSATVNFQVSANTGAARTGSLTIAGLTFTVGQSDAPPTGFNVIGSMAQIASGGIWNTTITLVNNGSASATARLTFFDDGGQPLTLPLTFPQNASAGTVQQSTLDQTIAPGAAVVVQTAGQAGQATASGWAQLLATGNISGFAVFAWNPGSGLQQVVSPVESRASNSFVLYFDNTGGASEGVALANVATQAANVPVIIRDDGGNTLAAISKSLPAQGHTQFMVTDLSPLTANKRGTLEFQTPVGGQISVLGIAALSTGAITSVPPMAK